MLIDLLYQPLGCCRVTAELLYVTWNWVKEVFKSLKEESDELFYWFADLQMKANHDKCHLLKSSSDEVSICAGNYNIKGSKCEELLSIKIYNKLNFNNHL